jgi:phosphotriesterase-related protein
VDNNWFYYGGFKITDVADVAYEADLYRQFGGSCIVDQTSTDLGRDPIALQRVSRSSGVHVVMGSGYYVNEYHPPEIADMTEDDVKDRIVWDCEVGVAGVKAGIIGEVGSRLPIHPDEEKVLRACSRASAETGLALSIHTGMGPGSKEAVYDALRITEDAGADPARTIVSHCEHRLATQEGPNSFDTAPIDVPHDPARLNYIKALADAGHAEQVVIGEDLVLQHWQRKHGGHGWVHIPETVVPLMRHKGFDEELIDLVLVQNPRRVLTIV